MPTGGAHPGHDAIVVGGGHNGLICAALLARAGRRVLILEANDRVGGACVTREFAPGFRVSAVAHLSYLLPKALVRVLRLNDRGLDWAARELPSTALCAGEPPLALEGGSGWLDTDAEALAGYRRRMARFGRVLASTFRGPPPRLGSAAWSDRRALAALALRLRLLGRREMREILRIAGMNIHDLLEETFDSPRARGALAFDALLGGNFGPRSPGTVLALLYRLAGESLADGGLAQPLGGMGALSGALAGAATAAGVQIRTGARVARILVEADRACGVMLESGERIMAQAVISNADPRTTFLHLLGARYLDAEFVRRVSHVRSRGLAAKLHLALNDLPRFAGVEATRLAGRLLLAPSLEFLERAYNHAKYEEYSQAPAMEITIPTLNDPQLAPPGKHVLSAIVQYAPHSPRGGWPAQRERFAEICVAEIETLAPGLRAQITGVELLTPADLEAQFGMQGGHWHHAELAFDQFLMVRPVPGATQYEAPLPGLYLCGAGCHPGGGVMGAAGRNAARRVLATGRA